MQKSAQATLVAIAFLLGAIVSGLFAQRAGSQSPIVAATTPSSVGRYQLITEGNSENVFDTQTGQIWWHDARKVTETGPPVKWYTELPLPATKP